jgi:hypothetical protein
MARLWTACIGLALTLGAQQPQEDPGRPVLKRGGPAQKHEDVKPPPSKPTPSSIPDAEQAPAAPPRTTAQPGVREVEVNEEGKVEKVVVDGTRPRPGTDELVERAREAAYNFDQGLPNFICDQHTSRFKSTTFKPSWKLQDRVQLELVYVSGKEDYRNIKVNGKAVKKGGPEDTGTWSSGEFGTVLMDIMNPATDAKFRVRGDSDAVGIKAKVYDYNVIQPNSHWQIRFGRTVKPAYKGALWIDPETARVLRIEMNSKQLPLDYEIDTVETVLDYGWVTLSGQKFLLPLKSQNLTCQRGTFICTMNEIEFRNYRKFQVESQVLQVESEIVFPEDEKAGAEKSKTTPPSLDPNAPKPDTTTKKKKQ